MWRAYLFLALVGFLSTFSLSVVHPVLPLYVESLGVSYEQVGLLFSAYSFTWAALQLYTGYLADKLGRKRVALLGFTSFNIAIPLVGEKDGLSPSQIGVVLSSYFWSFTLFQVPIGIWAEKRAFAEPVAVKVKSL